MYIGVCFRAFSPAAEIPTGCKCCAGFCHFSEAFPGLSSLQTVLLEDFQVKRNETNRIQ